MPAHTHTHTYTDAEIQSALNTLKHQEEKLVNARKDLNEQIRRKRKNIKYYLKLDKSQTKIF